MQTMHMVPFQHDIIIMNGRIFIHLQLFLFVWGSQDEGKFSFCKTTYISSMNYFTQVFQQDILKTKMEQKTPPQQLPAVWAFVYFPTTVDT